MSYAVLLLLDLVHSAVLKCPLDDIGLIVGTGDSLRLGEGGPEFAEVLQLDEVPHVRERRLDHDALQDRGGRGDGVGRRHGGQCCVVAGGGCHKLMMQSECLYVWIDRFKDGTVPTCAGKKLALL